MEIAEVIDAFPLQIEMPLFVPFVLAGVLFNGVGLHFEVDLRSVGQAAVHIQTLRLFVDVLGRQLVVPHFRVDHIPADDRADQSVAIGVTKLMAQLPILWIICS